MPGNIDPGSLSSVGKDVRYPRAMLFSSPGVLNWFTFSLPPSSKVVWLSSVLFPGIIAMVSVEEQREAHLYHFVWKRSQKRLVFKAFSSQSRDS